jgi:hypothetical protein
MLCNVLKRERESENIKERRKIYAAGDFSDKYDFAHIYFQISNKIIEIAYHIFKKTPLQNKKRSMRTEM